MTSNIPNRRPRISRRPHITTALVHTTTNIPKRDLRILRRSQLHYCSRTYLLILLFYRLFSFDSHSASPGVVVLSFLSLHPIEQCNLPCPTSTVIESQRALLGVLVPLQYFLLLPYIRSGKYSWAVSQCGRSNS